MFLFLSLVLAAASPPALSRQVQLDEISARGRRLFAYDLAASRASDVVEALKPPHSEMGIYIAVADPDGRFQVRFGKLNEGRTRFLVSCEAIQSTSGEFEARHFLPPRPEEGYSLAAAKAFETVKHDLSRGGSYNLAIVPDGERSFFVYAYPDTTDRDGFRFGADDRWTFALDGEHVLEKKVLHKAILRRPAPSAQRVDGPVAGFHVHVLGSDPVETDVFAVLASGSPTPELIVMPDKTACVVAIGGSIRCSATIEEAEEAFKQPK